MVGPDHCDGVLMTAAVWVDMQRGQGKGTCSLHTKEKACSCLMLQETLLTLPLRLPGWDNDGLWFELAGFCYFAVQPWKMSIVGEESESWDLGFQRARMWVPVTHGAPPMWWMKTAKRPAVTAVYLEHVGEDLDTQIRCCNRPSPGGLCLNVLLGKRKCLKKENNWVWTFCLFTTVVCLPSIHGKGLQLPEAMIKCTFHFSSWCSGLLRS